jgi:ribonuclease HI
LKSLKEPCKVRLMTDSRYVVETMNGRFRKKKNLEWWNKLEHAASKHDISWEWTKGHAGHEIQEIADKTARKIATLGRVDKHLLEDAVVDIGVMEI